MRPEAIADLEQFRDGSTVSRWDAARRLMAARQLVPNIKAPSFRTGLDALARAARDDDGLERLLAVDLITRFWSFVKSLRVEAETMLRDALRRELPPASLVTESAKLPPEAKPAEVRENIALALTFASGDWVLPYVLHSLAEEERSQRCRIELARQLGAREKSVDRWLQWLNQQPWDRILPPSAGVDTGASRLRDIAIAIATQIREQRTSLEVTEVACAQLATLCQRLVYVAPRSTPSWKVASGAAEACRLLEELLLANLTLIAEPDAYSVLATIFGWWKPLPYPKEVQEALQTITSKLTSAITLRARMGQRSEGLVSRLNQALGDPTASRSHLMRIADNEHGLTPEIDDWLRGRVRVQSPTSNAVVSLLGRVSAEDTIAELATLLRDALEVGENSSNRTTTSAADRLHLLVQRVRALGARYNLEVVGAPGEVVEFSPAVHETADRQVPRDVRVKLLRPMVVRRRQDGGADVLVKALVDNAQ